MDWFPVLSQLKSLVQFISGNKEGARQTQENFSRQCPVVSQARGLTELALGRKEDAVETFKEGLGVLDSLPVIGHVKGTVHYIQGDKESGDNSMKAASRTTVVVAASVGGFFVGGPVGSAVAGAASGYAMDGITTGVHSAIEKEYRPSGIVKAVTDVVKDPRDAGKWFDAVAPVAVDVIAIGGAAAAQAKWAPANQVTKIKMAAVSVPVNSVAAMSLRIDDSDFVEDDSDAYFDESSIVLDEAGVPGSSDVSDVGDFEDHADAPSETYIPAETSAAHDPLTDAAQLLTAARRKLRRLTTRVHQLEQQLHDSQMENWQMLQRQQQDLADFDLNGLASELEEVREKMNCKICMDAEVQVIFIPCRHLVCCRRCAERNATSNMLAMQLTTHPLCPICRTIIDSQIDIILP